MQRESFIMVMYGIVSALIFLIGYVVSGLDWVEIITLPLALGFFLLFFILIIMENNLEGSSA